MNKSKQIRRALEMIAVLILALYPLRHIHVGLDLWDTGYNYANFEYMGLESMDSMWLFSTYLSNAVGHVLTFLPFGKTLLGLNFYTGLTVSLISVLSYTFFTRHLKYSKPAVFIAGFVALNLCWCPTALLYNYLTYLFMFLAVAALYIGLTRSKRRYLFASGVLLGLNVFVRFSNLPECLFIFAVWVYSVLEAIEESREEKSPALRKRDRIEGFKRLGIRTIWCVLGYAVAAGAMLGYISIRYGFTDYIEGIKRLFGMQDVATGYSARSMIMSVFNTYFINAYWFIRVTFFAVCGVLIVALGKFMDIKLDISAPLKGVFGKKFSFTGLGYFMATGIAGVCICWLMINHISEGSYAEYGAITGPAVLMLSIIVIWAVVIIFMPKVSINEKLMAGFVVLILFITPIGSNNGLFPAYNNLFIVLPWFASRIVLLLKKSENVGLLYKRLPEKYRKQKKAARIFTVIRSYFSFYPLKIMTVALMLFCSVTFVIFGWNFTFAEAKNAADPHFRITAGKTLQGIRMSREKAEPMLELIHFIELNDLEDKDLITYGYIPALSFYLQMPSAFNPWMDLPSYRYEVMEEKINELCYSEDGEMPLVITAVSLAKYYDGENDEEDMLNIKDKKWLLIMKLFEAQNYELVYENEKFAVFTVCN